MKHGRSAHYLYRATVLAAVGELAPAVGPDCCASSLLPAVLAAAKDKVPNVRFAAARLLGRLPPSLPPAALPLLRAALEELGGDGDPDVRFYAAQSLKAL